MFINVCCLFCFICLGRASGLSEGELSWTTTSCQIQPTYLPLCQHSAPTLPLSKVRHMGSLPTTAHRPKNEITCQVSQEEPQKSEAQPLPHPNQKSLGEEPGPTQRQQSTQTDALKFTAQGCPCAAVPGPCLESEVRDRAVPLSPPSW